MLKHVSNLVIDGAYGAVLRGLKLVSVQARRRRRTRITNGGNNEANDASPLNACQVTKKVDCRNPILSNNKASDVVNTKSLVAPKPSTSKAKE